MPDTSTTRLLYAGIDEAGYGPLLGPLCVGCAVFETTASPGMPAAAARAGAPLPPCLWKLLDSAVCRAPGDKRRRIAVDDSKKLKGAKDGAQHPLRHLERAVTAFSASAQAHAAFATATTPATTATHPLYPTDDDLLAALHAPIANDTWHTPALPLPLGNDAGQLRIATATLRTALTRTSTTIAALRVHAISAHDFNRQAARINNKATINFMAAMRHVDAVRRAAAGRGIPAFIALDQQGGRRSYVRPLATSFPDARIRVLDESDTSARYQLDCPASGSLQPHTFTVTFEQGGEDRHLPIALASMAAKFARELHMRRLNAFFAQHIPEVKPTAGYVQDGRRFLDDVRPVVERLGLPEAGLVRCL